MAAVTMPKKISVVLVKTDFVARRQFLVSPPRALRENTFAGLVLGDDLPERRAFGSGIFRMCEVVVKTGAICKHKIAFYFLETERTIFVNLVVSRLIGILEQFPGAKAARIEMWILQLIIPFQERVVLRVTAHQLD